ncbi:serine/threonine protein kinase [Streptomyces tanashiensis]
MLVADRYRLHVCIGRGGMGEVWQATDEVLGRAVAVKLMLAQATDPSAGDRFRLEAQTAARLSHPHVVGVFDFGTWDGKLFLVMELVEGDSLAGSPSDPLILPAERVAVVAAHAAAGLAAAHRQGVVHRDIKPGNLLVDAEGTVKLADFGIARFVDDPSAALTTTGQIVGTGLYLAPERALGQPASPASDVYSLGCVLYQLLTGRPPFRADTATALLYQHIDTAPVPPSRLGAALARVRDVPAEPARQAAGAAAPGTGDRGLVLLGSLAFLPRGRPGPAPRAAPDRRARPGRAPASADRRACPHAHARAGAHARADPAADEPAAGAPARSRRPASPEPGEHRRQTRRALPASSAQDGRRGRGHRLRGLPDHRDGLAVLNRVFLIIGMAWLS